MMTKDYLTQALKLAEIQRGFCAPNPSVGAVLVKDQRIIASGYHLGPGHPHAEAITLAKASTHAQGATLYVTLEPCCHRNKKTAPCTEAIIKAGVSEVIYAVSDPNPAVSGQGEQRLNAAGVRCSRYLSPAIEKFYASYQHWWHYKQPFVTTKLALSLDGKIAGNDGQRIYLTSKQTQRFTHQQRKRSDALLTTATTICNDDPLLNVRLSTEIIPKPLYILDRQLQLPETARIFTSASCLTIFHQEKVNEVKRQRLKNLGAQCISVANDQGGLNLQAIIYWIGQAGYHDLWVEAGGRCTQALIQNALVQRSFIYIAPKIIGSEGIDAFTEPNILEKVRSCTWTLCGSDVIAVIIHTTA